jgi:uncharacterized protein DUF3592
MFLILAVGMTYSLVGQPIVDWNRAKSWRAATCEIALSRVHIDPTGDLAEYSADLRYRFMADGISFDGMRQQFGLAASNDSTVEAAIVATLPVGARVPCWYDPANPWDSVIDRGRHVSLVVGLLTLGAAVCIGIVLRRTILGRAVSPPNAA